MTVYNLGSVNVDNLYQLSHLPLPGETISAGNMTQGLGGKGANMSVAMARAGTRTVHIGAVGPEGKWATDRMLEYGVDTRHLHQVDVPTGHANICLDQDGENSIVIFPGANHAISDAIIGAALTEASPGDFFVTQNETNGQGHAAKIAHELGLRVIYAAAPFDVDAIRAVLPYLSVLVLNEVEAQQLVAETGSNLENLALNDIVVTMGGDGCLWVSGGVRKKFEALKVDPVDTTGAGDTFTGYLIAGLDRGMPMEQAIGLAMRAGALMVTRMGTADVIPDLKEVQEFTPS